MAMPIVLVAFGLLLQMLSSGSALRTSGTELWVACSTASDVIEQMRNENFEDLFRLYNADPFDDPNGPGTAPGNLFRAEGLAARNDDPDGFVGEVFLPFRNTGTEVVPVWEVREDVPDRRLEMPRDLNGDQVIDALDHGADYTLLPVVIRVEWFGRQGPRSFEIATMLTELQ